MKANATRWDLLVGSTQDGMVWFDGKKITPNDARKMGKALEYIALEAFDGKARSVPLVILVEKKVTINNRKPEGKE